MASVSLRDGTSSNSGCDPADTKWECITTYQGIRTFILRSGLALHRSSPGLSDSQTPGPLGHSTTIEPLSMLSDRPTGVTTMVGPGGYEHRLYPGYERPALEHSRTIIKGMPRHHSDKSVGDEYEENSTASAVESSLSRLVTSRMLDAICCKGFADAIEHRRCAT